MLPVAGMRLKLTVLWAVSRILSSRLRELSAGLQEAAVEQLSRLVLALLELAEGPWSSLAHLLGPSLLHQRFEAVARLVLVGWARWVPSFAAMLQNHPWKMMMVQLLA